MGRSAKRLRKEAVKDLSKMSTPELVAYAMGQLEEATKSIEKLERTTVKLARMFVTQLPFTRRLAKAGKRKVS